MSADRKHDRDDQIAKSMEARERNVERSHTKKLNNIWLWLGVAVLVILLLWWIFSIGFVEDETGVTNFGN